jgi:adenosylcobinamide-GDP ribazoletransferase
MREIEAFFAAIRFFTRIPVPAWVGHSQAQLDHAARYFPLVGIIVGAIGAAITEAAAMVLPVSMAILLGMVATILATGAFHEDGLADACDGFGGGWEKLQILTIMKDSRIGSYGAIGIGMVLTIKFNALAEVDALAAPPALVLALIAGHAASRLAPVLLMRWLDYVREDETAKSKPLAKSIGNRGLALAAVFALAPCLLLEPVAAACALGGVLLVTLVARRYFLRHIGGYTGDCLGATQQVAEIAFYVGLLCAST